MIIANEFSGFKEYLQMEYWELINDYITQTDFSTLEIGIKNNLDKGITSILLEGSWNATHDGILEAHRKYFDLHYTLAGTDYIVSKPTKDCSVIKEAYNDALDYILFEENYNKKAAINQFCFCLISPDFAHMAMSEGSEYVKKIVFKIPINN